MIRSMIRVLIAFSLIATATPALAADVARTIRMEVSGLVCGFCAQGIDKQMRNFEATRDVYVNLERGVVAVEIDPGADIADEVLNTALTDAGYTLTNISRVDRPLADIRREAEHAPR